MVHRKKSNRNQNLGRVIAWLNEANSQLEMLYRRNLECWNCGSMFHKRFQCPHVKKNKCSYCGKQDTKTSQCTCEAASHAIDGFSRTPRFNIEVQVPNEHYINQAHQSDDDPDIIELHPDGNLSDLEKL